MSGTSEPRKQSLYFPRPIFEKLQAEARRADRSLSWIVQLALRNSWSIIAALPTVEEMVEQGQEAVKGSGEKVIDPSEGRSYRRGGRIEDGCVVGEGDEVLERLAEGESVQQIERRLVR